MSRPGERMVFSQLLQRDVSNASEEWRHECECRWLLTAKPTRFEKHLYLFGVTDRAQIFRFDAKAGTHVLREDLRSLWPRDDRNRPIKPLMAHRSLEAADQILADAKKLYDQQQKQ